MDVLNTLIDASIRGTLFGITLFFFLLAFGSGSLVSSRGRFTGCFRI